MTEPTGTINGLRDRLTGLLADWGAELAVVLKELEEKRARIAELEGKLSNAQIIDPGQIHADGQCVFGATVELEDANNGNTVTYQIVGDDEADIKQGKISISSPLARALIGKSPGDLAEVRAPGGVREYEILDVKYI